MICEQKGNLVYMKWHDKHDVNIYSTNFDPLEPKTIKKDQGWAKYLEKNPRANPLCL